MSEIEASDTPSGNTGESTGESTGVSTDMDGKLGFGPLERSESPGFTAPSALGGDSSPEAV